MACLEKIIKEELLELKISIAQTIIPKKQGYIILESKTGKLILSTLDEERPIVFKKLYFVSCKSFFEDVS